jgi:hypothetical protein
MDATYWAARLRALEERLQEHVTTVREDDIGGDPEYRRGYRRGRETAYVRSLSMVRALRRDLTSEAAREAR